MKELIKFLNDNNIPYKYGTYAYIHKSIIIKNKNYSLEIYESHNNLVSDLHKLPYTWGIMGSTTMEQIKSDLEEYFNYSFNYIQFTLFDNL